MKKVVERKFQKFLEKGNEQKKGPITAAEKLVIEKKEIKISFIIYFKYLSLKKYRNCVFQQPF